ncbi:DUF418 domain-containing protein [Pseudonocardia cypriaca]|uniref:Putative membrane protein YeiB n=1 Tax=Pseudonocardia cypriaca TaxID=882449 RepID=A0A543G9E5_9PSEU|nr:DUF418 domain-containing protein [Pseudonocardia cypriaca]TQM42713.1 putative membrane protein YeiB [Pseudonocardia cypriaca]
MSSLRSEPPVAPRVRALAPDLARGTMLAVIALAHSQVLARPFLGPVHTPGPALDTAVQTLLTLFVDSRGYPMFAALFGYGMVQILRSREPALGRDGARRLLRRRGSWLVAFGFVHVLLLFPGDILASYGVLALLFVGALRWPAARLFAAAGALAVLGALVYGAVLALPAPGGLAAEVDPLTSAVFRIATFPLVMPMNAVMAAAPLLVGIWAGRSRLLDEPARHRRLLVGVAAAGITIAAAGAVPHAFVTTGFWHPGTGVLVALGTLHTITGYAGGLGYAALVGLVAARLSGRAAGPVTNALAACGRRSMTCYLAQSVAWLLLLEPYLADLSGTMGVAAAAAVGLGVWLVTVVAADLLRRTDRPGPAEALLRRLAYRT